MSEIRGETKETIHTILGNLRQRIELEDDDFHYDAVLEAHAKILAIPELAIVDRGAELPEVPYILSSKTAKDFKEQILKAGWVKEVKD